MIVVNPEHTSLFDFETDARYDLSGSGNWHFIKFKLHFAC